MEQKQPSISTKPKKANPKAAKKPTKKAQKTFNIAMDLDDEQLMNGPPPSSSTQDNQDQFMIFKNKSTIGNNSSTNPAILSNETKNQLSDIIEDQMKGQDNVERKQQNVLVIQSKIEQKQLCDELISANEENLSSNIIKQSHKVSEQIKIDQKIQNQQLSLQKQNVRQKSDDDIDLSVELIGNIGLKGKNQPKKVKKIKSKNEKSSSKTLNIGIDLIQQNYKEQIMENNTFVIKEQAHGQNLIENIQNDQQIHKPIEVEIRKQSIENHNININSSQDEIKQQRINRSQTNQQLPEIHKTIEQNMQQLSTQILDKIQYKQQIFERRTRQQNRQQIIPMAMAQKQQHQQQEKCQNLTITKVVKKKQSKNKGKDSKKVKVNKAISSLKLGNIDIDIGIDIDNKQQIQLAHVENQMSNEDNNNKQSTQQMQMQIQVQGNIIKQQIKQIVKQNNSVIEQKQQKQLQQQVQQSVQPQHPTVVAEQIIEQRYKQKQEEVEVKVKVEAKVEAKVEVEVEEETEKKVKINKIEKKSTKKNKKQTKANSKNSKILSLAIDPSDMIQQSVIEHKQQIIEHKQQQQQQKQQQLFLQQKKQQQKQHQQQIHKQIAEQVTKIDNDQQNQQQDINNKNSQGPIKIQQLQLKIEQNIDQHNDNMQSKKQVIKQIGKDQDTLQEQFGSVTVKLSHTNKNKPKGKGTKLKTTGKTKKLDIQNDLDVDIGVEQVKNIQIKEDIPQATPQIQIKPQIETKIEEQPKQQIQMSQENMIIKQIVTQEEKKQYKQVKQQLIQIKQREQIKQIIQIQQAVNERGQQKQETNYQQKQPQYQITKITKNTTNKKKGKKGTKKVFNTNINKSGMQLEFQMSSPPIPVTPKQSQPEILVQEIQEIEQKEIKPKIQQKNQEIKEQIVIKQQNDRLKQEDKLDQQQIIGNQMQNKPFQKQQSEKQEIFLDFPHQQQENAFISQTAPQIEAKPTEVQEILFDQDPKMTMKSNKISKNKEKKGSKANKNKKINQSSNFFKQNDFQVAQNLPIMTQVIPTRLISIQQVIRQNKQIVPKQQLKNLNQQKKQVPQKIDQINRNETDQTKKKKPLQNKLVDQLVSIVRISNRNHLNAMKQRLFMMKQDIRSSLMQRQERQNNKKVPDVHYDHIIAENIQLKGYLGQDRSNDI